MASTQVADRQLKTAPGGSGTAYYTWNEVTGTTQAIAVNNAYIANNAGLVTLTLPTTSALGDKVQIVGKGAGLWKIAQNASQIIHVGQEASIAGTTGYVRSINQYDCIELVCIVANTEWVATTYVGNLAINQ